MQDLNFFLNPHAKRQNAPVGRALLVAIAVIAIGLAGILWYIIDQTNRVNLAINTLESQFADPQFVSDQKELDLVKQKVSVIKQYDQSLSVVETYLDSQARIDQATLDTIAAAIPSAVSFTTMTVTSIDLSLEALSTDDSAKALLIYNLKGTGLFKTVELQTTDLSVDKNAGPSDRTLTVLCTFKEVTPE